MATLIRSFWVVLLGVLALSFSLFSATSTHADGEKEIYPSVRYLADKSHKLSIDEVMALAAGEWDNTTSGDKLSFGYTQAIYWFKFDIAASMKDQLIQISYPLLDEVQVYFTRQGEIKKQLTVGDTLPFSSRPIANKNFLIEVPSELPHTVYLRVDTSSSMRVPIAIWQPIELFEHEQYLSAATAMYFGLLLCMALYNLFTYLVNRDRSFAIYTCYIVVIGLLLAGLDGNGYHYLWPNWEWFQDRVVNLVGSLVFVFASLVAIEVLQTAERSPRLHKGLQAMFVVYGLVFVCSLILPYEIMIRWVLSLAIIASSYLLIVGITLWRQGLTYARIYTIALGSLMFAIILNSLGYLGFLDSYFIQRYAIMMASALEILLMSLVLAIRFNEERKKRFAAERKLTTQLEMKVRQRTEELESLMKKLREANVELEVKSNQDRLTKVFNRGLFEEDLPREVRRARRGGYDLALIIIDIDHFKPINDNYGHLLGDKVLIEFANLLKLQFRRAGDRIYRYGGEEFVILMPGTDELGAHDKAMNVAEAVRDYTFYADDVELTITVSVGIAVLNSLAEHTTGKQLLDAADNALYRAKNSGRDQIRLARLD